MAKNRLFSKKSKSSFITSFRQAGIAHLQSRLDSKAPHTSFKVRHMENAGNELFVDVLAQSWRSWCWTVGRQSEMGSPYSRDCVPSAQGLPPSPAQQPPWPCLARLSSQISGCGPAISEALAPLSPAPLQTPGPNCSGKLASLPTLCIRVTETSRGLGPAP